MRNNGVSNDASSCFAACALQLQQHGLTRSRWLDFPTSFISPDRCTYACFMKILFCYVLVLIASIWPTLSYCAQQFLSTHAWFTWSLEHLLSKFLLPFLAMEDAVASVNKTTIFIWESLSVNLLALPRASDTRQRNIRIKVGCPDQYTSIVSNFSFRFWMGQVN